MRLSRVGSFYENQPILYRMITAEAARFNEAYLYLKANGLVSHKKELADKLGYSYPYLTSVFTGQRELSDKLLNLMEEKFGIKKAWLKDSTGKMIEGHTPIPSGPRSYFTDNTIYHVPADQLPAMMKTKAPDPISSNLTRWCVPGLVGEYYSFALETDELQPTYSKGCIIVVKRMDNSNWIAKDRHYVLGTAKELTAVKILDPEPSVIKTSAGNFKRADIKACYMIVMGTTIPSK